MLRSRRYSGVIPSDAGERRLVVAIPAQRDHVPDSVVGRLAVDVMHFDRHAGAAAVRPLHECRHGYAALMIAAGVNVKALSTFMGHANIGIKLDQYGHLLPGAEDEAAGLLDAFLARQVGARRPSRLHRTPPEPAPRADAPRCTTSKGSLCQARFGLLEPGRTRGRGRTRRRRGDEQQRDHGARRRVVRGRNVLGWNRLGHHEGGNIGQHGGELLHAADRPD